MLAFLTITTCIRSVPTFNPGTTVWQHYSET